MPDEKQDVLNNLLEKNRENILTESEKQQLDNLMEDYDRSLLIKSEALSVAVERGLIESPSK
jgi:predicted solute-binding protein